MDCEGCVDAQVDGGETLVVFVIGVLEIENGGGESGVVNIGWWWSDVLGWRCGEEFLGGRMCERHSCWLGRSSVEVGLIDLIGRRREDIDLTHLTVMCLEVCEVRRVVGREERMFVDEVSVGDCLLDLDEN